VLLEGIEGVRVQLVVASSRDHTLDQMRVVEMVLLLTHVAHLLPSMPGDCGQLTGPTMITGFPEEVVPQSRQFYW
jgi:hypothetical protein